MEKIVIFILSLILAIASAHANTCIDSDNGVSLSSAGKVIYSVSPKECLPGAQCFEQMFKEFDRCLGEKKVLKFSCDKNEMVEVELSCPEQQICLRGKCAQPGKD